MGYRQGKAMCAARDSHSVSEEVQIEFLFEQVADMLTFEI